MAGLTEAGLEIRTREELEDLITAQVEEAIPGIDLSEGPEHQFIGILAEELAIVWEALQAIYASIDAGAEGGLLDRVAALTGTRRRAATRSLVTVTLRLGASVTLPAGSVAAVDGAPEQQFRLVEDAPNAAGIEADVTAVFESIETGPIAAPGGTLTAIVTPFPGWVSVTNPAGATLGRTQAEDPELRETRIIELAGRGADSYASIRAAVLGADEDVLEVQVIGNETLSTDGDGRPGKSFECVVWDGETPGADNDAIAQAIWVAKPAGISPYGDGQSGNATDGNGITQAVPFTRATALRGYVELVVVLAPNAGSGWEVAAQAAIEARGDLYRVGETAYASQLICAVLDSVPAIVAVTELVVDTAAVPVTFSIDPAYDEIVRIAVADVSVSEAP